jgi:TIR domain
VANQSVTVKAIFVSYASQDAEAAERICTALRQAGLEVWFDKGELRGGEAWDSSIRKQVKGCQLFLPIISANTQAREEGYFRREWNLAVGRTLDMADDKAFLLPVVVDTTLESDARVPEKFRDVQWTRLPAGEASAAFVERVRAD